MEKKTKLLLILCFMAFFANGDTFATTSVIGDIAQSLDESIANTALSITAYMMAFGVFTLFFGPLSDRFGKAKIINIAGFGSAIFSILSGFAWDLNSLIAFRTISGMFASGIMPVAMSLTGDTFSDSERQGAIARLMGFGFFGMAAATFIGGSLAFLGSWRLVYILYGAFRLLISLIMLKILERDIPKADSLNLLKFYGEAFQNKGLIRVVLVLFFNGFAIFGCFSYAGVLLAEKTELNTFLVGLMLSAFGLGTVLGGRISPQIKKLSPNNFLLIAGMFGIIAFLMLAFTYNGALLVIGLILFGFSFIIMQSSMVANAQGRLVHRKGTVMSLTSFFMSVGAAVGTQFNSYLLTSSGVSQLFFNSAILFFFVAIVANIVIKK